MREAVQRRRVETVGRQRAAAPRPQWQNLFQAPDYPDGYAFEEEEPVLETAVPPRRQRAGRPGNPTE